VTSTDRSPVENTPTRRTDVEWVELDGEAVVYDPRAEALHRLNVSAAAVWEACDGTASTDRIIGAFEEMFAEPPAIASDVRAIIDRFRRLGLLKESPVEDEYGR
jgi:hypothetical protein